jgi:hypothetical protein
MIQLDPNHDPPPPAPKAANLGGVGGSSATTLYLQDVTDINVNVTEEFGDLPLDRVKALVEQKRRAGSQDGGIVIALRALRKRLQHEAVPNARSREDEPTPGTARVEDLESRAQAIAPSNADDLEVQWLMVYLEEGASDREALQMLAERRRNSAVSKEGEDESGQKQRR